MLSGSQDTAEQFKCLILMALIIENSNDTPMTPEARTRTPMNSQKQLANGSHTLNDIRAFVAVVEAGGFSQAARRLGLSQPAVSQRVRNFENSCGLRLLDRRGVPELTAAGREIFHRARLVLARAEELDTTVADLRGLRAGRISFGYATPAFAIQLIARFCVAYPGIVVDYQYGNTAELFDGLRQCRLDVAVTTLLTVPEDLVARKVASQRLMLCAPAGHPLAQAGPVSLQQIHRMPLLMREPGSMTRALVEKMCTQQGVSLNSAMVVPTREAVKEAVVAGLGLGFVLEGEFGADSRLAALELVDALEPVGVYLLCHSEAADLPAVASLLEHAEQSLAQSN